MRKKVVTPSCFCELHRSFPPFFLKLSFARRIFLKKDKQHSNRDYCSFWSVLSKTECHLSLLTLCSFFLFRPFLSLFYSLTILEVSIFSISSIPEFQAPRECTLVSYWQILGVGNVHRAMSRGTSIAWRKRAKWEEGPKSNFQERTTHVHTKLCGLEILRSKWDSKNRTEMKKVFKILNNFFSLTFISSHISEAISELLFCSFYRTYFN